MDGNKTEVYSGLDAVTYVRDLNSSMKYFFWIKACNLDVCSEYSDDISGTTIPRVPNLVLYKVYSTSFNVGWDSIPYAHTYEYENTNKYIDNNGSKTYLISISGQTDSTYYIPRIRACDIDRYCSEYSPNIKVTTLRDIPSAPSITTEGGISTRLRIYGRTANYLLIHDSAKDHITRKINGSKVTIYIGDKSGTIRVKGCNEFGCGAQTDFVYRYTSSSSIVKGKNVYVNQDTSLSNNKNTKGTGAFLNLDSGSDNNGSKSIDI